MIFETEETEMVDMAKWPKSRDERLCPHGVGHPETGMPHHGYGVHGCDGCCSNKKQPMTDLSHLRTLAEKATKGPWFAGEAAPNWDLRGVSLAAVITESDDWADDVMATGVAAARQDNANYIAALSPDTVLALLDVVDWFNENADHPQDCILGRTAAMFRKDPKCECGLDALRAALASVEARDE